MRSHNLAPLTSVPKTRAEIRSNNPPASIGRRYRSKSETGLSRRYSKTDAIPAIKSQTHCFLANSGLSRNSSIQPTEKRKSAGRMCSNFVLGMPFLRIVSQIETNVTPKNSVGRISVFLLRSAPMMAWVTKQVREHARSSFFF